MVMNTTLRHRRKLASTGRRRAFALIDVIIGALMLGAGLAVIISLSSRSLAWQTGGEKRMVAAWLADELLTMVLIEGPEEYPHLYDVEGEFYHPFEGYFYSVNIIDNGPGTCFTVVATIGWEVGRGMEEIQIEAAIAPRGGDPDQPREPRERVDRDQRHYERLFGEEEPSQPVVRTPRNVGNARASGGAGRGGAGGGTDEGNTSGGGAGRER